MYRYTITFDADSLDEGQLRDILSEKIGITSCSIARHAADLTVDDFPSSPEAAPAEVSKTIMDFSKKVDMFAPRDLLRDYPGIDIGSVARRCAALVERGKLERVAHGIYSQPASVQIDQSDTAQNRTLRHLEAPHPRSAKRDDELLTFLAPGRDCTEVQTFLDVSRQRAYQKLASLMERRLVCRVPGPDNRFIYALDQRITDEESFPGWRKLTSQAKTILGHLPMQGLVSLGQFHASLNHTSYSGFSKTIYSLHKKGLIETPRLGRHKCAALTNLGRKHPGRPTSLAQLPPSDPIEVYGPRRYMILSALASRTQLTSEELSQKAVEQGYDVSDYPGLLQDMKQAKLIEKVPSIKGRGSPYRLTKDGKHIVDLVELYSQPEQSSGTH